MVADGKYMMVGEEPRPFFFLPLAQKYLSPITLMVRTASEPATLVAPLERILHDWIPTCQSST